MSTLLELPTATIEWALLSPLIVLLGVGCVGIVLEGVVPRGWRYLAQTALTAVGLIVALGLTILDWVKGEVRLTAEGLLALDGPTYVFWSLLLVVGLGGMALFAERQLGGGHSAFAASASTVPGSPARHVHRPWSSRAKRDRSTSCRSITAATVARKASASSAFGAVTTTDW